ncbi:MAG: hypothetical protein O3B86_08545, partial [Planctomycetota bacterium]|nr:hypothetical protein [Planctomycetota bacterium]
KAKTTAASIGLTRAVLLASDSKTAVAQLMKLSLEESVILLTEMPEKMIAKLLEAFSAGDKLQIERGHEIFQAIARGRIAETPGETLK